MFRYLWGEVLGNFSWSLTDLTPLDTTAPALSFIGTGINDASANSYSTLFETHGRGATGGTGDVSASAPLVAGQTAQAAVTTGTVGRLPPLSLFASGTTVPSAPGSFGQFDAQAASRDWVFTLAPQTQVTFHATSNLNVALTGGGAEVSTVTASIWVANLPTPLPGALPLPDGVRRIELQDLAYITLLTESGPQGQRSQGTVSVVFDNPTDSVATGYLSAMAYAYGHSLAAPVPEPEGWAMLLAGLGVVGICRRRMARNGSRPHGVRARRQVVVCCARRGAPRLGAV
jgi:hypothetical protein